MKAISPKLEKPSMSVIDPGYPKQGDIVPAPAAKPEHHTVGVDCCKECCTELKGTGARLGGIPS